ncbi:MAG: nodulation protein NfeD [Candidatus Altiarchaeota archaeon]|nr:nodulation protein NfeD [Candidatus Altiarchaeota archaeon]
METENHPEIEFIAIALSLLLSAGAAAGEVVYVAEIEGDIDAGTREYVNRVLGEAEGNADLVVLTINTRGGFLKAVQDVVDDVLESEVPVAGLSSGKFRGAVSGGAYILMASDIAAADTQSFVGSARPLVPDNRSLIPMTEYMEGLAGINNRNVSAARTLVWNNSCIAGKEALEKGAIDYNAENVRELLGELNISTAQIKYFHKNPWELMLSALSNPQLISLLILLGFLAAVYAVKTRFIPLLILPAMSFLISLWGVNNMYFSLFAVGLVALGVSLVSIELRTTRPGIFGMSGILASSVGILMSAEGEPFYKPGVGNLVFAIFLCASSMLLFMLLANNVGRLRIEEKRAEIASLIGETGRVVEDLRPNGLVKIDETLHPAYALEEEQIEMGHLVKVMRVDGKVLNVLREGGVRKSGHGGGKH